MTIVELLAAVGADNLTYQKLGECLIGVSKARRGVDITFGTVAVTAESLCGITEPTHVGFIVWVPIDHARRVQAQIEAATAKEGDGHGM